MAITRTRIANDLENNEGGEKSRVRAQDDWREGRMLAAKVGLAEGTQVVGGLQSVSTVRATTNVVAHHSLPPN